MVQSQHWSPLEAEDTKSIRDLGWIRRQRADSPSASNSEFLHAVCSFAYLNKLSSERKHGSMVPTLVSESGSFYCRVSLAFLSILKS